MMLWAMNIERATDEKGEPLPMDVDGCIEDGLVVYVFDFPPRVPTPKLNDGCYRRPLPFQCKISPRFPEAPEIIAQERETLNHK